MGGLFSGVTSEGGFGVEGWWVEGEGGGEREAEGGVE